MYFRGASKNASLLKRFLFCLLAFDFLDDICKKFRIFDGYFGKHFSVQNIIFFCLKRDQFSVCQTQLPNGIVEPSDPQAAECSLFCSPVPIGIFSSLDNGLFGGGIVRFSSPFVSFCLLNDIFSPFGCGHSSFDSAHTVFMIMRVLEKLSDIGNGAKNVFLVCFEKSLRSSFVPTDFSAFFGVEMILSSVSSEDLFLCAHGNFFGDAFSCFLLHRKKIIPDL